MRRVKWRTLEGEFARPRCELTFARGTKSGVTKFAIASAARASGVARAVPWRATSAGCTAHGIFLVIANRQNTSPRARLAYRARKGFVSPAGVEHTADVGMQSRARFLRSWFIAEVPIRIFFLRSVIFLSRSRARYALIRATCGGSRPSHDGGKYKLKNLTARLSSSPVLVL